MSVTIFDKQLDSLLRSIAKIINPQASEPDLERYGAEISNTHLLIKEWTEALRYYELGGTDIRVAKKALTSHLFVESPNAKL